MTAGTSNLLIMFADISGSTRLYETLGDVAARELLLDCINIIVEAVERHAGIVIKTIGDEVMSTFNEIDAGIAAACDICEAFVDKFVDHAEQGPFDLAVRTGMHFGPAILEEGDVFGDAVNVAARMVELAKPGQILTTGATVHSLLPERRATLRFVDRTQVKGKKDSLDIFEVVWHEEEATGMGRDLRHAILSPRTPSIALLLRYNGEEVVLDERRAFATLGRSKLCDITVDDRLTSRQHVAIEYRRGKFFITDQSTNGTYLSLQSGECSFLRREEIQLPDRGQISLGRNFDDKRIKPVDFELDGTPVYSRGR